MAIFGLGHTKIQVLVYSLMDGKEHDVVVKESVQIKRSKNAPSILTCDILRDTFSVNVGDAIHVIIDEGHHQFFGYVEEATYNREWASITAYDTLHFLQINETAQYIYEEKKASEVLLQIIREQELPALDPPIIEDTGYVIPYRIEQNSKYLDIIRTALDLTEENTGKRFYIWDDSGNICLNSERWLAEHSYIVITAGFIEDYSFTNTLDGFYTCTKVTNDVSVSTEAGNSDTRTLEEYYAKDELLYSMYGKRELSQTLNEGEDGQEKANTLLANNSNIKRTVSVSNVQGDITVRGGTPVLVDFYTTDRCEYIRGWFSVESVTHNIDSGYHTMELEITQLTEIANWESNDIDFSFPL